MAQSECIHKAFGHDFFVVNASKFVYIYCWDLKHSNTVMLFKTSCPDLYCVNMLKDEHKIIVLSVIVSIVICLSDAVIATVLVSGKSFRDLFEFNISAEEFFSRSLFVSGILLFGLITSRVLSRRRKSEEELDSSVRFLDTIFKSIRDPFVILDREFRIVKANDAYAEIKNRDAKELIGNKCYGITRGRVDVCEDCIVRKTLSSGDPCAKEKQVAFPDNPDAWIEIYTYPIFDKERKVSHVIEYVRDITDRKKVEEERQRLIQQLEFLSTTDSLTGLLNRRMLVKRLDSEVNRARRYRSDLSLILCDLDYFKEINDTHGHNAGDNVLKGIAGILNGLVRSTDLVGRYGGDEFLIIMPETTISGAEDMAERIRKKVQETEFPVVNGKKARTTISLGITHFQGGELDIYDLINRIDNALYTSKRAGRNQVYSLL